MRGTDDTAKHPQAGWHKDADVGERCCAFVDSTTDIFTYIRPDGEMGYVTSTEEILGRRREEFFETSLVEYIHPEDKERGIERFESAIAGEGTSPVELRFRHGDGHWIWIESTTSQIPPEYDLDGVVTVTREITERKRREQKLEETQAELKTSNEKLQRQNRRLDRFASVISHDLRNPLNVVSGRLGLAREECNDEHLEAMAESIDRMTSMIDELQTLAIGQCHVAKMSPVPIALRAKAAWSTTDTGDSELRVLIEREIHYEADSGLLDHIFENLFRNAVIHNEESVTVTVGSLADRPGFYVADDGMGIPSEHVDDILEYGYTTGEEGTGFGLTIVSEFVETHGWEIAIMESDDGGARFEIYVD